MPESTGIGEFSQSLTRCRSRPHAAAKQVKTILSLIFQADGAGSIPVARSPSERAVQRHKTRPTSVTFIPSFAPRVPFLCQHPSQDQRTAFRRTGSCDEAAGFVGELGNACVFQRGEQAGPGFWVAFEPGCLLGKGSDHDAWRIVQEVKEIAIRGKDHKVVGNV